jgi:DNA-binding protein HU-beta
VTKSELVDQVADRADLTKQDAARAVDAVLATVEDAPRTGERIQIAASRVPRFTAGSGLKSAVKGR